ncbi:N-alpha-acetyltransferase 25, NatB auxiliary subunit isoform X1 [Hydra vulgaris]|uniref:N-alpha-acetyltransferase 25, NatB auxiliary subunit isoform X1 n=1 Tax=Hydra vulgaris TaxID=6087 RepID=UPI001F5EE958|nr:N-alpha-acetyltransferase 25, NatB auxiliary subunit isoform X1 [Hydra vulgaris]
MAASKSHVEVDERRLRPVYDALDNLNNKQAIKLVDNILKKKKDFPCAKTLKALALIRMGHNEEALVILKDAQTTSTILDDATLQAMTMCFKETQMPEGIVQIYEKAVEQSPNNEEFLSHLFMACVRIEDYAKQQKAAMSLYKAFPKNPYYFWAVMSYVMQAFTTKDEKKKAMLFTLAERMVLKRLKESKLEAEEEVRLYLLILEELGKYEELLSVIQSDLGDKLKCIFNEKYEKEIEYLKNLKLWSEVYIKAQSLLSKCPDQWNIYQIYIQSFLELNNVDHSNITDDKYVHQDYNADVKKTLDMLSAQNPLIRGPHLAKIEFYKHFYLKSGEEEYLNCLIEYVQKFGSKPCCFSDLRQYANILNYKEKEKFIEVFRESVKCPNESATVKEKMECFMREACIECFTCQFGFYKNISRDGKFLKAKSYMKKYKEVIQLGSDASFTEPQYGDVIVLLAAYLLLDINKSSGDDKMIWHVLLFIEEALESSPTSAQYKLLLNFLYSNLGVYSVSNFFLDDLEIKYVMFDSIGYLFTSFAYVSGQFQATNKLYDLSINFFKSSQKECPEQIISSYKYGSFKQIPDMSSFKLRLKNSLHFASLSVEKLYLRLLWQIHNFSDAESDLLNLEKSVGPFNISSDSNFCDNRDLDLVTNFDSISKESLQEMRTTSFRQNVLWLRLRYLVLQIVSYCFGNIVIPNALNSQALISEITEISSEAEKSDFSWNDIHTPPPCHIGFYINQNYASIFIYLLECYMTVKNLIDTDTDCMEKVQEKLSLTLKILQENVTVIFSTLTISHGDNKMFNGKTLRKIVFYIETCNLTLIILSSIKSYLKQQFARKGKKKKESEELLSILANFLSNLRVDMEKLLIKLVEVKQKCVDITLDVAAIEDLFEKTSSTTVTKVWQRIQSSYQQSVMEIIQVLELKINFLDTIS